MKKLLFFFLALSIGVGISVTSSSCEKDDEPTATCTDGIQNGDETGVDCGGSCSACAVALQGTKWQSSGANVAPLLVTLFDTDSIFAQFNADFTYLVEQYDSQGAKIELRGTYTQSESTVSGIWNVEVNQTSPAALTSKGIFQITGNTMKYEIVQTEPNIGAVPPTAAGGFGSTNGGGLGTANVQNYVKIN